MTLHIIMLATLIIGGLACAWWLHRAYQERRKRQIYELAEEALAERLRSLAVATGNPFVPPMREFAQQMQRASEAMGNFSKAAERATRLINEETT